MGENTTEIEVNPEENGGNSENNGQNVENLPPNEPNKEDLDEKGTNTLGDDKNAEKSKEENKEEAT